MTIANARTGLALAALAAALAACQAPAAPAPKAAGAAPAAGSVAVYRPAGSRQCERGGLTLEAVRRQLSSGGIRATATRCALDGKVYGAACGMPDGRIVVAEIAPGDLAAARKLGYAPLAELPEAAPAACP